MKSIKRYYPIYRIYLTHRCNSDCIFCDTHNSVYSHIEEMPFEKVRDIIDEAISYGSKYIDFTGGQPLLYKHLPEVLAYCQSKNIFSEVTTNGINDYDLEKGYSEVFLSCLKYASQINISLDSLDEETYRLIRGVDTLENVKRVIKHLPNEYKHKVKIIFTITRINYYQAKEILDYAKDNNILVYFNPVFEYDGIVKKASVIKDENDKIFSCLLDNMYDVYSMINIHFSELCSDVLEGKKIHCGANRRIITIMANGKLANPCYHSKHRTLITNPNLNELDHKTINCDGCFVSSYFEYGIKYWLSKYSLLRGLSECLTTFKKYLRTNGLSLNIDVKYLNTILNSYIEMLKDFKDYYDEEKVMKGELVYDPRVYKIHENYDYSKEVNELNKTPIKTFMLILEKLLNKENIHLFKDEVPELLLRWFRWYSANYFNNLDTTHLSEDKNWIDNFFNKYNIETKELF